MKVLYVSTTSGTINAFLLPHIELLLDQGHQVDIACNTNLTISARLTDLGCRVFHLEFQRSPLKKQNYTAYKQLKRLIQNGKYEMVHTHTPVASACVRLACSTLKNVKVIYTAHGFHFYKGAPLKNWLIYYPIEKFLSKYTDLLITINQEDYERAKNSLKARRVVYLPGVGFNYKRFNSLSLDKKEKRKEIGVPEDSVVILSVGELNKNKNHETIIRALAKIKNSSIFYVICGSGPLENKLRELSQKLGIESRVKLLGNRSDMAEIYKAVDVFVFPSFREGLSVALMEAMSSDLPIVCSNIRGNNDLIKEGRGGFLIDPNDVEGFARAISKVDFLNNEIEYIHSESLKNFELENVLKKLNELYTLVIKEVI